MKPLYDSEEIMRVHDYNVARDAAIMNVVAVLKDLGVLTHLPSRYTSRTQ